LDNLPHFEEHDDYIEINDDIFQKPFVEKPVSAENHRINIYYPTSAGGGHQKLFRKVLNRSSEYCSAKDSSVRKEGSYIYEDFMPTDGTDVKVGSFGEFLIFFGILANIKLKPKKSEKKRKISKNFKAQKELESLKKLRLLKRVENLKKISGQQISKASNWKTSFRNF